MLSNASCDVEKLNRRYKENVCLQDECARIFLNWQGTGPTKIGLNFRNIQIWFWLITESKYDEFCQLDIQCQRRDKNTKCTRTYNLCECQPQYVTQSFNNGQFWCVRKYKKDQGVTLYILRHCAHTVHTRVNFISTQEMKNQ